MTARVIRRRKLRGKFRIRDARRERAYKQAAELHAYEEWVVLRLLCKRNVGQVRQWLSDEPERWRKRPLLSTFRRLRQRRLIDGAGASNTIVTIYSPTAKGRNWLDRHTTDNERG